MPVANPVLDRITSNLGLMRNEVWMGEDYIVCPVRMIVSGVLEGSSGPLYYPPDEIEQSVNAWNGIPIVVYHPVENGVNVSARNPSVMEKHFLGWVFNAVYNPEMESLDGEAWLSKDRLEECDSQLEAKYQILPRLQANMAVEVSTGLGTSNYIANDDFNRCPKTGKPFTHIARNFKPDHLAVLPDREGACSINDGCGLRTNQSKIETMDVTVNHIDTLTIEGPMKKQLIAFITTNCDCWKSPEDKGTLNNFSEDKLKKIKASIIDGKMMKWKLAGVTTPAILGNARKVKAITTNAEGETQVAEGVSLSDLAEFFKVDLDPSSDPMGYIDAIKAELEKALSKLGGSATAPAPTPANQDDEEDDTDEVPIVMEDATESKPPQDPTATTNKKKKPMVKQLTEEQFMRLAPDSVKRIIGNAMKQNEQRKSQLVEMMLNHHCQDENNKALLKPIYQAMDLDKLEVLASTIPHPQTMLAPSYIGNAGGVYNNRDADNGDSEVAAMPLPWDHK